MRKFKLLMVRGQEEKRAKMAGTHVIAHENFDRRASRKVSDSRDFQVPIIPFKFKLQLERSESGFPMFITKSILVELQ